MEQVQKMATLPEVNGVEPVRGPHPSYIETAKPYIFESQILDSLTSAGISEARDDNIRLQGIMWIDNVRKAMHL